MTESPLIRSFFAVKINPQAKKILTNIQNQLKQSGADVKWVNPNQFHFTLKFLGENTPDRTHLAAQTVHPIFKTTQSFTTFIDCIGSFPSPERPQIIWVGLNDADQHLQNISANIEKSLEAVGFPRETRTFQPHLTLGRVKSGKQIGKLRDCLFKLKIVEKIIIEVNEVIHYQSTLTPSGPIYTILQTYPLGR